MIWLKQSTSAVISFGPFLGFDDGVTPVSGLAGTGANQTENTSTGIRISKNGGAFAARHATATASSYDALGNYLVTLDATDTNTCGRLRVQFANEAVFCPVWQDFMVVPAMVYDSMIAGTDRLDTNLTHVADTAQTARDLGTLRVPRVTGAVVDDPSNSASTFLTDLLETETDHWRDSFLTFLTGDLAGQARQISGYNGGTAAVTTTNAFSAEPSDGDTFVIVND